VKGDKPDLGEEMRSQVTSKKKKSLPEKNEEEREPKRLDQENYAAKNFNPKSKKSTGAV